MSKAKKTTSVQELKLWINNQLNNPNLTVEEKMGMITTIEHVLHGAGAYQGFMYTNLSEGVPRLGTPAWVERKYF